MVRAKHHVGRACPHTCAAQMAGKTQFSISALMRARLKCPVLSALKRNRREVKIVGRPEQSEDPPVTSGASCRKVVCLCAAGVASGSYYFRREGGRSVPIKERIENPDTEAAMRACLLEQTWSPQKPFALSQLAARSRSPSPVRLLGRLFPRQRS